MSFAVSEKSSPSDTIFVASAVCCCCTIDIVRNIVLIRRVCGYSIGLCLLCLWFSSAPSTFVHRKMHSKWNWKEKWMWMRFSGTKWYSKLASSLCVANNLSWKTINKMNIVLQNENEMRSAFLLTWRCKLWGERLMCVCVRVRERVRHDVRVSSVCVSVANFIFISVEIIAPSSSSSSLRCDAVWPHIHIYFIIYLWLWLWPFDSFHSTRLHFDSMNETNRFFLFAFNVIDTSPDTCTHTRTHVPNIWRALTSQNGIIYQFRFNFDFYLKIFLSSINLINSTEFWTRFGAIVPTHQIFLIVNW